MTTTENITALRKAIHAEPANKQLWLTLADVYADAGDADEEAFWRFAVTLRPIPYCDGLGGWM